MKREFLQQEPIGVMPTTSAVQESFYKRRRLDPSNVPQWQVSQSKSSTPFELPSHFAQQQQQQTLDTTTTTTTTTTATINNNNTKRSLDIHPMDSSSNYYKRQRTSSPTGVRDWENNHTSTNTTTTTTNLKSHVSESIQSDNVAILPPPPPYPSNGHMEPQVQNLIRNSMQRARYQHSYARPYPTTMVPYRGATTNENTADAGAAGGAAAAEESTNTSESTAMVPYNSQQATYRPYPTTMVPYCTSFQQQLSQQQLQQTLLEPSPAIEMLQDDEDHDEDGMELS